MPDRTNTHKLLIPLAMVLVMLAIAVPTWQMVGCDMGAMPFMPAGQGIYNVCPGEWVFNSGPNGIVPTGIDPVLLSLVAAILVSAALFAPQMVAQPVRSYEAEPPPPPDDPRGVRLII